MHIDNVKPKNRLILVTFGWLADISTYIWVSTAIGWLFTLFTLMEEYCLSLACRDTANFAFLGIGMGWLGLAYFSLLLVLLRKRAVLLWVNRLLCILVFTGIGAEFRLLWIQIYIIGSWCPYCVTICCSLSIAAVLLVIEKIRKLALGEHKRKYVFEFITFTIIAMAIGLIVAIIGVKPVS